MAHGQGMPPRNIEVIVGLFRDGRDSIVGFLAIQQPTPHQKKRMIDMYDAWLALAEEGAHCSAIGQAYDRCMSREGTQRTKKLEAQYRKVYGELPVDAAVVAAD